MINDDDAKANVVLESFHCLHIALDVVQLNCADWPVYNRPFSHFACRDRRRVLLKIFSIGDSIRGRYCKTANVEPLLEKTFSLCATQGRLRPVVCGRSNLSDFPVARNVPIASIRFHSLPCGL